jgi:hypothetical protein
MAVDRGPARARLIVPRLGDGLLAAHGAARLLWGCAAGGFVWWVYGAAGLPHALALAGVTVALVATAGLAGAAMAAVGVALVLHGIDTPMRAAAAAAVVIASLGSGGPAWWLGRRCGALPVELVCAATVSGIVLIGPAGGFLAPLGVAVIRVIARPFAPASRKF